MKNVQQLTEGAILLAAFAVLILLNLYVPLVGGIFNLVLPAPFILFSAKNSLKNIAAFYVAALFISFLAGSFMGLVLLLLFGSTGVVIGYLLQKNKSRTAILISSSLILVIGLVVLYAVSVTFMQMNFIDKLTLAMNEYMKNSQQMLKEMGREDQIKQLKEKISMIKTLAPSFLILGSIMVAFAIQLVCFPIAKRFGVKVQPWGSLRNLSLPRSLLWYYLIVKGANIFIHPEVGFYFYLVIMNATYILEMFLVLQGVALLVYLLHKKSVPKGFGVIVILLAFMVPTFHYIIMLLGVIDIGYDFRKRFESQE